MTRRWREICQHIIRMVPAPQAEVRSTVVKLGLHLSQRGRHITAPTQVTADDLRNAGLPFTTADRRSMPRLALAQRQRVVRAPSILVHDRESDSALFPQGHKNDITRLCVALSGRISWLDGASGVQQTD